MELTRPSAMIVYEAQPENKQENYIAQLSNEQACSVFLHPIAMGKQNDKNLQDIRILKSN